MNLSLKEALSFIFLIAGIIGIVASFALTYDKIQVLKDPGYSPGCNISPILSCGSVMETEQASILGVPNTIFGLMAFSMLTMLGVVLVAEAKFKRWLWLTINAGALGGFIFFIYLFFQAVYRINAICPYCFAVWLIVPPIFWYTTLYNIKEGNLKAKYIKPKIKNWILHHHGDILIVWYLLFFAIILNHFWYYWQTLI